MWRASTCILIALLSSTDLLAEAQLKFHFEPESQQSQESGQSGSAALPEAYWSGGQIRLLDNPALRASGKHAFVIEGRMANVIFSEPVMNVEFFFTHGDGVPAGQARAYSASGVKIGTVSSRLATSHGDLRNFVSFKTRHPISMIEFDGGSVDAFTANPFAIDFSLVQGGWVQDLGEAPDNMQGIYFDFIESADMLSAAWFTYMDDPIEPTFDTVGALDNRWLTAQLTIEGDDPNVVSGQLFASSGGAFARPNTGMQESISVGTMEITFLDCDLAIVKYDIESTGLSGQFEIMPGEKRVRPDQFTCDPNASRPFVFQPDVTQTAANITLLVRVARDPERIAMQFHWRSNKNYPGILHDIRQLDDDGEWSRPMANISPDSPTRVNEDRIALIWETETSDRAISNQSRVFGCFQSCHSDMNRMPDNTGDAGHYIVNSLVSPGDYQADMWHWRGARSGPMGFAEDTWISAELLEDPNSAGRQRDANSVGPDGNRLRLRENQGFNSEYDVVVQGQTRTIKLPTWVYDPHLNSGFYFFNDGLRLITESQIGNLWYFNSIERMAAGELQHGLIVLGPRANAIRVSELDQNRLNEVAAQALAGGIINTPFLNDDFTGDSDQHDIRAIRQFENGYWTVTMIRDLNTGSEFDIDLSDIANREYTFGVAVHDQNDGERSHNISVPLTLGGDIVPAVVDDVDNVSWMSLPAFSTLLFVPGDISLEWLQDKKDGHRIPILGRCSNCHGQDGIGRFFSPVNVQD